MKIILKGIMIVEDVFLVVEVGVDVIVVLNYGGCQLDGVLVILEVFFEIMEVVKWCILVIFDGGIMRGSDIFKVFVFGVDLCFVGWCVFWGLVYDGQKGVEVVLYMFEREFYCIMMFVGLKIVDDILRSMLGVWKINGFGISRLQVVVWLDYYVVWKV